MGLFVYDDLSQFGGRQMRKRTWFTLPNIIGVILIYIVLYIWQPGGSRGLLVLTDVCFALFALLAAVLALRASRLFEPGVTSRRVWLFFGAGMTVLTIAELVWGYYHNILNRELPFPSAADVLWAIGYLPVLLSLLLQYRALRVQISPRRKLLVSASYLAVLFAAFLILSGSILSSPGEVALMQILISAYYLVGNLSVAFIAILSLLFLGNSLVRRPWQYIVISVLLFAAAGLAFAYGAWNNLYATGSNLLSGGVDVAYVAAYLMAAAGGYQQLTLRLPSED
jgi:hypothetical protein